MKHLARFLLLCVAGCMASGDGAPTATTSTAFHIDRLDHAADGKPYFVHGTLGSARTPIQTLADVDFALSDALPAMARSIATIAPLFSSDRMVRDYVTKAYLAGVERSSGG